MPVNRILLLAAAAAVLLPSASMAFSPSSVSGAMEDAAARESAPDSMDEEGPAAAPAPEESPLPQAASQAKPGTQNGASTALPARADENGADSGKKGAAGRGSTDQPDSDPENMQEELADTLRDAVIEFAEDEYGQLPDRASYDSLEITVPRLDARRIKSDCGESLQMELSKDAERAPRTNTVRVRCTLPGKSWRLPVQIRITKLKKAVVASADIERDEVLGEGNLSERLTDVTRIKGGAFDSIAAISGSRAKRRFSAGDPVPAGSYCAVCRNDEVTLEAGNAVLTISTAGTALEDGSVGSEVRVRNGKSGKTVSGRVLAPGRVRTGAR
ncbi:MAG: flagellar basal body P-ring formation protein FlgA [Succinivibrionaceae bacterium]|nr:flagellar basal body P-ring formation protein FlgA [Succinivibrionaceae bacterium]